MPTAADTARASALFALLLDGLPGVGTVTAGRLLRRFPTVQDVRRTPREQVLARIQGAPRADRLVAILFDEDALAKPLTRAEAEFEQLQERHIRVLTPTHPAWPPGVEGLPRSERPHRLFAFGRHEVAPQVRLSIVGDSASEPPPALTGDLLASLCRLQVPIAIGGPDCFRSDLAVRFKDAPVVVVLGCGLARMDRACRSAASALVHEGGLLLSPFPLDHGPYAHDDRARAYVQAALASASVCLGPTQGTADEHALAWAVQHRRSVFGLADAAGLPEGAHPLRAAVDVEWVEAALSLQDSEAAPRASTESGGA